MNNNTETIEQAAEQYSKQFDFAEDSSPCVDFTAGANWQKEQDEAKYKALLDSHNALFLYMIGRYSHLLELKYSKLNSYEQEIVDLINKVKNI